MVVLIIINYIVLMKKFLISFLVYSATIKSMKSYIMSAICVPRTTNKARNTILIAKTLKFQYK